MTPADILSAAVAPFGLTTESFLLLPRGRYRTHVRRTAIVALREGCPYLALVDIARMVGVRGGDHTTVLYHLNIAKKKQPVGRPPRPGVL